MKINNSWFNASDAWQLWYWEINRITLFIFYLKPMDSFGMWWKSNEFFFSSLNHNFILLCELLMPCQLFAQKCSNCQEITKISKCFVIGYYYITTCHSKQLPVGLMVLSDGKVHFLKIEIFFT